MKKKKLHTQKISQLYFRQLIYFSIFFFDLFAYTRLYVTATVQVQLAMQLEQWSVLSHRLEYANRQLPKKSHWDDRGKDREWSGPMRSTAYMQLEATLLGDLNSICRLRLISHHTCDGKSYINVEKLPKRSQKKKHFFMCTARISAMQSKSKHIRQRLRGRKKSELNCNKLNFLVLKSSSRSSSLIR